MKKIGISQILNVLLIATVIILVVQGTRTRKKESGQEEKSRTECAVSACDSTTKARIVLENIHSRKSVREYQSGRMLSREQMETLVRAGMAAPTARNMQPWEFVIVRDTQTLRLLSQAMPFGKMLPGAGGAIAVLGNVEGRERNEGFEMWVQDCSAATENILLAAEAMGLGGVWLGVYPLSDRMKAVSEVLGLPANVLPMSLISLGYPAGTEQPKDKYKPGKIHWERY